VHVIVCCIVSVLVIYVIAVTCLLLVRNVPRGKRIIGWLAGLLLALCPLLIPANEVIARALVSVLCADAWFRGVDLARVLSRRRATSPSLRQCLEFLIPFPTFLAVYDDRKRRASMQIESIELWRVAIAGSLVIVELGSLHLLFEVPALKASFILDHIVKLLLFVATTETLSQLALGLEHLVGFDTVPIIRRAYLSQTVGEFWCRYNTRVHRWLQYNVFLPCGGLKSPVGGVMLAFLISAVFHELMFGIATSRFDGYQFAFFMLQAPAVLISQKIERLRTKYGAVISVINRLLTITWFGVSSMLFFHGVDRVFHLVYTSKPWLP
jgi:hypothetical protein